MYSDPSGHFLIEFIVGAVIGAIFSGFTSGLNPQSMLMGALIGGISGGVFAEVSGIAGGYLANATLAGAMGPPTAGMMLAGQIGGGIAGGAAAGATAGVLGAALYGGNVFDGMLTGAGYGALSGGTFGAINGYYGSNWTLGRVGLHTMAGGGVAELTGGKFKDGAVMSFGFASARYLYNQMVPYDTTWEKGGEAVVKQRGADSVAGANNVGFATDKALDQRTGFEEGSTNSKFLNNIPGLNSVAGLHDTWMNRAALWGGDAAFGILNYPTMLPAAALSSFALMTDLQSSVIYTIGPRR